MDLFVKGHGDSSTRLKPRTTPTVSVRPPSDEEFRRRFANPILKGREPTATAAERQKAEEPPTFGTRPTFSRRFRWLKSPYFCVCPVFGFKGSRFHYWTCVLLFFPGLSKLKSNLKDPNLGFFKFATACWPFEWRSETDF